jgi:hypothetical protein
MGVLVMPFMATHIVCLLMLQHNDEQVLEAGSASGISPASSMMMVSFAVFVRLVNVSNGRSAIARVFVIASCGAVLDV